MAITHANSVEYFKGHRHGHIWTQAGTTAQQAALTQARRMLSRELGRALSDSEAAYAEGDAVRDEYAAYEQALWLIQTGVVANGEGSAPQAVLVADGSDPEQAARRDVRMWSPEALAWLGYRGAVTVRG